MSLTDKILATVRTAVAALVGAALAWLAREHGLVLDEETSAALVVSAIGVTTAVYHALASWVQRQWPAVEARYPLVGKVLGWAVSLLLGVNRQPSYSTKP